MYWVVQRRGKRKNWSVDCNTPPPLFIPPRHSNETDRSSSGVRSPLRDIANPSQLPTSHPPSPQNTPEEIPSTLAPPTVTVTTLWTICPLSSNNQPYPHHPSIFYPGQRRRAPMSFTLPPTDRCHTRGHYRGDCHLGVGLQSATPKRFIRKVWQSRYSKGSAGPPA